MSNNPALSTLVRDFLISLKEFEAQDFAASAEERARAQQPLRAAVHAWGRSNVALSAPAPIPESYAKSFTAEATLREAASGAAQPSEHRGA